MCTTTCSPDEAPVLTRTPSHRPSPQPQCCSSTDLITGLLADRLVRHADADRGLSGQETSHLLRQMKKDTSKISQVLRDAIRARTVRMQ